MLKRHQNKKKTFFRAFWSVATALTIVYTLLNLSNFSTDNYLGQLSKDYQLQSLIEVIFITVLYVILLIYGIWVFCYLTRSYNFFARSKPNTRSNNRRILRVTWLLAIFWVANFIIYWCSHYGFDQILYSMIFYIFYNSLFMLNLILVILAALIIGSILSWSIVAQSVSKNIVVSYSINIINNLENELETNEAHDYSYQNLGQRHVQLFWIFCRRLIIRRLFVIIECKRLISLEIKPNLSFIVLARLFKSSPPHALFYSSIK